MRSERFIRIIAVYLSVVLLSGCLLSSCKRQGGERPGESETITQSDDKKMKGVLTDKTMKNKDYTVRYIGSDGITRDFDVLSVDTMSWSGWETANKTAGYANIRTEDESLRIKVNRPGTTKWKIVGNGVSDIETSRDNAEMTVRRGSFVSVEANGSRISNLMVYVSEPTDDTVTGNVTCTREIRLKAGVYDADNCNYIWEMQGASVLRLKSGDHLILEEGAVLKAGIIADNADNIAITGSGIIDTTEWNGAEGDAKINAIKLNKCKNVYISDITVRNSAFFCVRGIACENVEIKNISAFSAVFEGDGIDFHGINGLKVSGCVLRNSDDCIALYPSHSDVRDVTVENCVLWTDRAHNINLGTHGSGDPENRHYIENVTFSDIYVPEGNCPSVDYQGVIGISLGDEIICRDVTFSDFVIEQYTASQIFVLKIMKLDPWNPTPGYLIDNVNIRNINYLGDGTPEASVFGYSADRIVRNVTVENYRIRGNRADTLEKAGISVGEYTENIVLK